MIYGFCTGFATAPLFSIDYELYKKAKNAGFDYSESPLMSLAELDQEAFNKNIELFKAPVLCNLFPGCLNLYTSSDEAIEAYTEKAFSRMKALDSSKIIFGSGKARAFSAISYAEAYKRLYSVTRDIAGRLASENDIQILIEPLKRDECNMINTLEDGYSFVRDLAIDSVRLMADLYHMEANGEDIEYLRKALPYIHHIHIAGKNRSLKATLEDGYILNGLRILREEGYNESISFETDIDSDMKAALDALKGFFEK